MLRQKFAAAVLLSVLLTQTFTFDQSAGASVAVAPMKQDD